MDAPRPGGEAGRTPAQAVVLLLAWFVATGLVVWGLGLFLYDAVPGFTASLDEVTLEAFVGSRTDFLTTLARFLTRLGGVAFLIPLILLLGLLWRHRWGTWWPGLLLVLALTGANTLNNILKAILANPRPPIEAMVTQIRTFGFPSGHTADAVAVFGAVAVIMWAYGPRRVAIAIAVACGGITIAVAITRVYLGAHWLSDVTGGAVLGILWLTGLFQILPSRPAQPAQPARPARPSRRGNYRRRSAGSGGAPRSE